MEQFQVHETLHKDLDALRKFIGVINVDELKKIVEKPELIWEPKYSTYKVLKPFPLEEIVEQIEKELVRRQKAEDFIPL